jgi:hypothetical protein
MLAMAFSLIALPTANAHTPPIQIPTHAYIVAEPNPIGVGQTITIYMWLDQVFGVGYGSAGVAAVQNDYRFHNYQLTITASDGTVIFQETFDIISDPTSSKFYPYVFDEAGTYTLNFTFPGQAYAEYGHNPDSILVNDTYTRSSAETTLTVQEEQVAAPLSSAPLPTQYWTRPIYGENTNWWSVSSNWLGTGAPVLSCTGSGDISAFTFGPGMLWGSAMQRYPGDAVGPQTGHVMWTKSLQFGGVVGGDQFPIQGNTYFEGSAYNQRYTNPIIIAGRLYYTEPLSFTGTEGALGRANPYGPTVCVDLRTGEVIWSRTDIPALSFGYVYDVEDPNQHGVYPPILCTSNFAQGFDAFTGEPLFNVTGVPSGMEAMGPHGEHLRYVFSNLGNNTNPNWYLAEWNSSKLFSGAGFAPGSGTGYSPAISGTVDGSTSNRYDWNVSVPQLNSMTTTITELAAFYDNMLLCMNGTYPAAPGSFSGSGSWAPYTYFAFNLNTSSGVSLGKIQWHNTIDAPAGNITVFYAGADPTVNVFVETRKETINFVGYSLTTGEEIWGPTPSQESFDYYGQPGPAQPYGQVAYGKLYSSGYGGTVYCYDLTNGDILWTYGNGGTGNSTRAGLNTPYGDYPTYINAVGNGVIYLVTTEHTVETPIYKGALARAINATDGTEIWTLSAYTGEFIAMSYAIADGFATFYNGYDNQIYVVGRGPSATTVTAPDTAVAFGTPVVIKGTVTDISAGTGQDQQAANFPNGVPCASDASMKDWMGYVYQQQPCPTNFTGVQVTINVLDSNGNYRPIGTATTSASGTYSLTWTPDIPGNFTVTASFAGTNGYWPSGAETAFTVMESPPTTPGPTPMPGTMTDTYVTGFGIAIIIILIIFGILLLRKH